LIFHGLRSFRGVFGGISNWDFRGKYDFGKPMAEDPLQANKRSPAEFLHFQRAAKPLWELQKRISLSIQSQKSAIGCTYLKKEADFFKFCLKL
jgi:hypothetical protein